MSTLSKRLKQLSLLVLLTAGLVTTVMAGLPQTRADGVTVIHLDEYNGYFAAQETLASLKAGDYEFVVTNKADKLVGFQIQELGSNKQLDMFPLEPGETRTSKVTISDSGVRYRCPINPTPWYDIDNVN
jgi:hypothetical protein